MLRRRTIEVPLCRTEHRLRSLLPSTIMDVLMPVKIPRENDAKMFRTRDNVECFIFNVEHASLYFS